MNASGYSVARFQKITTLGGAMFIALWLVVVVRLGHPLVAFAGAAAVAFCYAGVLGIEFILLRTVHGADPAPRAKTIELCRAWLQEIVAAPLVFCWRQPFRSQRWPDQLPSSGRGRRGVLLVHGLICNRGIWNAWLKRLASQQTPYVAVNLEPMLGGIDNYVVCVEAAVRQLEHCTGLPPMVVAHSMGGLAVRKWSAAQQNNRICRVITIGTPHQGTWLARFAASTNTRQMRLSSDWLTALASSERANLASRFTCYYSNCDNVVFPPTAATLPGADNRLLHGVAHVHLVDRPEPWLELQRWLLPPNSDSHIL